MENKKTLTFLNSTVWYRFLKVVFCLFILIVILIFNFAINTLQEKTKTPEELRTMSWKEYDARQDGKIDYDFNKFIKGLIVGNLIIVLVFEGLRRSFYYIILGTIKPKK